MIEVDASFSGPPFWVALPPLPLLNVGTPLVESIEHYAARLAWVTGTNVEALVDLPAPYEDLGGLGSRRSSFCGPGRIYKQRIANLEALTSVQTLRCGTFYVLDELLAPGGTGRRRGYHRWCPKCFDDWDESRSCELLQWSIDLRVTCPIHGCNLEDSCPHCNSKQTRAMRYEARRTCSKCRKSLAGRGVHSVLSNYTRWAEDQLSELIEFCATPGQATVSMDTFETFVRATRHSARDRPPEATEALRHLARLKRSSDRSGQVHLHTLINACALHSTSVRDLLIDPTNAASTPLRVSWSGYSPIKLARYNNSQASEALSLLLQMTLDRSKGDYLPHPRSAMRDFNLERRRLSVASLDTFNRYMTRYHLQAAPGELKAAERAFHQTLNFMRSDRPNPFGLVNSKVARRRAAKALTLSKELAHQMVRCTTNYRRWAEFAKAKVRGFTAHEFRVQRKFGRL